jgi:energy-coupling factor transport system permease protein
MSNFEFSRNLSIGQYLPLDSVIHRLDPRARILGAVFILGTVTLESHLPGLLAGLVFVLLGLILARIPLAHALRGLIPPLPFLIILGILQLFFNPYRDTVPAWFTILGDTISSADLLASLTLILRFAVLILGLSLISYCLSTSELAHGLEALLKPLESIGLPTYDLVMVVQVALRFLPYLGQTAERIAKAQASRGGEWGSGKGGFIARAQQVIPLIVPMFLVSLRRADNLALAMDARGYGGKARRTSMVELHFRRKDFLAVVIAVAASAVIIFI